MIDAALISVRPSRAHSTDRIAPLLVELSPNLVHPTLKVAVIHAVLGKTLSASVPEPIPADREERRSIVP